MKKIYILKEFFDEGRNGHVVLGYYSSIEKVRQAIDRYLKEEPNADLNYCVVSVDEDGWFVWDGSEE